MSELEFEAVYAAHAASVRRLLQRLGVRPNDLDDVVQDTFVTVHRLLPEFEGRAAIQTWLHAICWRVAASYHRRSRRRGQLTTELPEVPVETAEVIGLTEGLHVSLGSIEPADRDLIALYEIGGLSLDELSTLTGLTRSAVKRRIERTRGALERSLEQGPDAERPPLVEELEPGGPLEDTWAMHRPSSYEYACADYCFSRLGDTVLARWRGACRVEPHEMLAQMMLGAADEAAPGGITFVSLIEPSSPPPDRATRHTIGWMARQMRGRLDAAAFIALSPGLFRLVPPIINAAVFLSGTQLRIRFFNDPAVGMAWLAQFTRGTSAAALLGRAESMRKRIDDQVVRVG